MTDWLTQQQMERLKTENLSYKVTNEKLMRALESLVEAFEKAREELERI